MNIDPRFRIEDVVSDEQLVALFDGKTSSKQRALMNGGLSRSVFRKSRSKLDESLSLESSLHEMCTLTLDHIQGAFNEISEPASPPHA